MSNNLFYYIDPNGIIYLLNNQVDVFFLEEQGYGLEESAGIGERVAYHHGTIYTGFYIAEREILLRLGIKATDEASWRARDNALLRNLSPLKGTCTLGTLRRVSTGNIVRDINCLLAGYSKPSKDREGPVYGERVLKFWCPDPFFYDPTEIEEKFAISGGTTLSFPITFSFDFGESLLIETRGIENTGDIETPPTITILGPLNNPKIQNLTTDKEMELLLVLDEDDKAVIDMNYCTVKWWDDSEGEWADVEATMTDDSVFWTLLVGDNIIKVTASNSSVGALTVSYYTKYMSA